MTTATIKRDGDTLRVRGELDFDSVAELWAMTKTLFRDGTVPRIDLNGVRHSNSAGVALLVEWLRHARSRQQQLVFVNIPAQMRAIIRVVDLETVLPAAE
ncbi:MAG TPA: STAS domain-containing protein [Candidatus Competibacter sp.]|nr:STAS domain-containing protein [Candidatus Competibacter sp.]